MISLERRNPNNSGTGGVPTLIGRTLVVSSLGSVLGQRQNWTNHFSTLNDAMTAAISGDVIVVFPGTYTASAGLAKNGVSYYAIGEVNVEYYGSSFLFDFTGFTDPLSITGGFNFLVGAPASGCFNMPTPFNFMLDINTITCVSGRAISIEGNSWPLLSLKSDIVHSDDSLEAVRLNCTNSLVNFVGNIYKSVDSYGVSVNAPDSLINITGNLINRSTPVNTFALLHIVSVNCFTLHGNLDATFVGKSVRLSTNGGEVCVNGSIVGAVTDNTTSVNNNSLNSFALSGELFGAYFGSGKCRAVLSGNVPGIIVMNSSDSFVTVNGNFTRAGFEAFDVSAGTLVVNGSLDRTSVLPSTITGGSVSLNGDWISTQPVYLSIHGMIYLNGGTLRCGAAMSNLATGAGTACIQFESGTLILHGSSMRVAGSSPPILSIGGNDPIDVKVYGDCENVDSTAPRSQVTDFTILNNSSPSYSVGVDGNTYTYVPLPGDTVNQIAIALGALILAPSVSVGVVGAVITVTAVVPGTPFPASVLAGAISLTVVAYNHAGLNNLITGTVIVVDSDVE